MNQHYRRHGILFISLFLLTVLSQWVQAKLVIEPARPIIAIGQQIQLRVLGEKGEVTWQSGGTFLGKGNQITYVAPNEVGQYYVSASTDKESAKAIITVLTAEKAAQAFAPEKSVWEVFANRNTIEALSLSEDKKILWVGTTGGLEKRDAITGELLQKFTNLNGLPDIQVSALLSESERLWVATKGGLTSLDKDGKWTPIGIPVLDSDGNPVLNSDGNFITSDHYVGVSALAKGNKGDKWLGVSEGAGDEWFSVIGGLAHLSENGEWKIFHTGNSELPNNDITALASDANGVWIGTVDGLAYLNNDNGEWKVFKTDNSNLPGNWIETVVSDGDGGVWIGTSARFLVMGTPMSFSDFLNSPENYSLAYSLTHLSKEGKWTIFNTTNSDLPSEMIRYLARDHDGIWICTWGGLAHLDDKGNWTIFQKNGDSFSTDESANYIEVIIDDGQDGLWIGTWGHGLAHLNNNSSQIHFIDQNNFEWPVNLENPDFTANTINSLLRDGQGDLWVGTENGLIYFNDNQKLLFNTENSSLPDNSIYALLDDGNNGLWIGTWGGLAHLSDDKKKWNIFNTENSKLPDDFVNAIVSDENGGIWIGTWGGLAHMDNHHEWTIYNSDNSKLPNDHIRCLANDGEGGIWIGGDYVDEDYHHGGGLTHLDVYGEWKTFNTDNSPLPSNIINSLVMDNERRLWVGTDNGIVYLDHSSEWIILSHTNLDIPEWMDYTFVTSLTIDNDGKGLWIGASLDLFHLDGNNKLSAVFDSSNSGLPDTVLKQVSDGNTGWWIGTNGGLAHLTFSQKPFLCEKANVPDMTDEQCAALLKGSRSAILIHPNGQGSGYNQDYATEVMATHAYQTLLYGRGYDIDEIYFLSYKPDPDFNGDGIADSIVTAPVTLAEFRDKVPPRDLTLEDVTKAFDWAKANNQKATEAGLPEQPLVVIFIDHGLPNHLLLSPTTQLDDVTLNRLIKDYQTTTGNQAIVIMEACYTGTLINGLQANNRVIISSTGQDKSYYSDYGRVSFTQFYFDELYRGANYRNGLDFVKSNVLAELGRPLNQQTPRLEDLAQGNMAATLCLNGCFGSRREPELTPQISSRQVAVGDTVKLAVAIKENGSTVTKVETSVVTPKDARERNDQGFSLNAPLIKPLTDPEKDGTWEYEFKEFTEPGEYTFFFQADYKIDIGTRTLNARQTITLCVEPCQRTTAYFEVATGILHLPAVEVPTTNGGIDIYQAELVLLPDSQPLTMELNTNSVKRLDNVESLSHTQFDPTTGIVQIPVVEIPEVATGEIKSYRAELQLVSGSSPMRFTVKLLESKAR